MAAHFRRIDSNTAAVIFSGGQSSVELCSIDTVGGDVVSQLLPASWLAPLRVTLKRLIEITQPSARLTADFARLLMSVVDADGGSDSSLSISASGSILVITLTGPANATALVSLTRSGSGVKPAASSSAPVDLSAYAKKTDIPSLSAYALKTDIPVVPTVSDVSVARTLFVDAAGNDTTGNGSLSKPFRTIGKALLSANAVTGGYVRINVAPGEYVENVTVTRARTILAGSGVDPEDHTTSIIGSLTVDCSSATQKFNDVVAVQGIYVNNGAKVTGAGAFMCVFTDCYLTTGVAATNALLTDCSHTERPVVYVRNSTLTKQTSATTDIVKLSKGDVRMDTVRVYGAISGTGNGILISNDATLTADRLQVDHGMSGAGIRVDGSYAGVALTLSNAGVKCASPALYLKNDTGVAAFLWQVMLMAGDTSNGKYAIDGVLNATANITPPYLYGRVTFGPATNTSLVAALSAIKASVKMTDL